MRPLLERWPLLLLAVLAVGTLLLLSCGGDQKEEGTPGAATKAAGTPIGQGDTTGVTDTEVKLGIHIPLSQNPAAAYAPIAFGMEAYFDYINAQGGVYGRKITFLIGDDHYNPPDTGVRTRFQGNPDYVTEGAILGQYIAENYDGKKLGLLLQNDEMGVDGEKGLRRGLEGSDVKIVATETYEVVQPDVTAQTQRLKNAGVDVIATYSIPPQAASLVKAARETLDSDAPIIVSGINCSHIFVALGGVQAAEGVMRVI